MNRKLFIASYKITKEKGYCIMNTTKQFPEICKCRGPFEDITVCKAMCDYDIECIAFSFDFGSKYCFLASHPPKEVCEKRNGCTKMNEGNLVKADELVGYKRKDVMGCFIKKKGDRIIHNISLTHENTTKYINKYNFKCILNSFSVM